MERSPTTSRSLDFYYHINGDTFEKQYKEVLSGYREWKDREHAAEWLVFPENTGPRLCIDETSISDGELYTIVSNPDARGKKGSLVAIINGVKSEYIINILRRKIPFSNLPRNGHKDKKRGRKFFLTSIRICRKLILCHIPYG